MLVLWGKINERIVIGDGITVQVQAVEGRRVTLGIDAPKDVTIVRGELLREDYGQTRNTPASTRASPWSRRND
jgi:carbon storage regulator